MIAVDEPWPSMTRTALSFASSRHAGQHREIDGAPFIAHPLEVARLLQRDGQPDHVVAAGLLHDVLEKTATTRRELEREFGTRVTRLVAAVSDDPSISDYQERKRELRDRVARSDSDALAIYAADKIAKVRELGLLPRWRATPTWQPSKAGSLPCEPPDASSLCRAIRPRYSSRRRAERLDTPALATAPGT